MRWYDLFSWTYDLQLEAAYRPYRTQLVEAAQLTPGMRVVDLCCGTGQSFDLLVEAVGPTGEVIGLDASSGMLARARSRIAKAGWENVRVEQVDLLEGWPDALGEVDAVVAAMALTALPDFEKVVASAWEAVRAGGRFAILDAHAAQRTWMTVMVEKIAQADLDRSVWEPLAERAEDFERVVTDASPGFFGGQLVIATGTRT